MKDLLVYIPPKTQHSHLLEYATSLAANFGAHLDGTSFTIIPELAGHYANLPAEFYRTVHKKSLLESEDASRRFVEFAKRASVPHSVRTFETFAGDADDVFARAAQAYDLAIVPQTDRDATAFFSPRFDNIMLMTGRPTLFVPTIQRGPASVERILLCWNGDRSAARAAGDALPIMKRAKTVDVLQIEPVDAGSPRCHASEVLRHLERHGMMATQHVITRDHSNVGAAILSFAADCGSTLIVMGGYGHSRAREALFGGVTRELLQSMTVPVLMSH